MIHKGNLLFFVSEDWYFAMHFLHFAVAAQNNGWKVIAVCNTGQKGGVALENIKLSNVKVFPLKLSRSSINPLEDLKALGRLTILIKKWKPTLIFSVALKPMLFSEIFSRIFGINVVSMMTGLGFVFSSNSKKAKIIQPLMKKMLRLTFSNPRNSLVMLNQDDLKWAKKNIGINDEKLILLPGIGVDTSLFKPIIRNHSECVVVFVGRMLRDKGLFELIEAVRILKKDNNKFKVILVGAPDPSNPESVAIKQLEAWQSEDLCEYRGHIFDIHSFLENADILVLPSYREGMPTCILEASSSGLPCVATSVPGCKDAIIDGETGLLVPVRDAKSLAIALKTLIEDPVKRKVMGSKARLFIEKNFSQTIVSGKMLEVFESYCGRKSL